MSTFSRRIKINPDVLMEFVYDDTNYKSDDYKVLTNLKEKSKSYLSTTGLNTEDNNLVLIDSVQDKYSPVDVNNFNFLRIQNYASTLTLYDTVKLYFPSGFDFYEDYLGFYLNIYANGYDNNTKYSLTNLFYTKNNTDVIKIFDLPRPFLYDGKYWVRSIEFDIPSIYDVSNQRIVTNSLNEPNPNTINSDLTYGEGISTNSPIFVDFSYITSKNSILGVDYLYTGDLSSFSIPQVPEFAEVGVVVRESTQGDYFEIYGTYLGSNENMDDFAYNESIKGNPIELEYVVQVYEENILTTTQKFEVTENFTEKILFRPIIKFSNTTAAIDVEMRIVNRVDGGYISKFGSIGISKNINKYGRTLTRLNMESNVLNSEIFNVKFKNVMNSGGAGIDNTLDIVRIPYPVMVDKYRVLTKSTNASPETNDYVPNGVLEVILTSFDTVLNFNIAKDINSEGEPMPYDLTELNNNSKLLLTFKSDTEKVEKEIFYDADNNYEIGNIYYKIDESDYLVIRRMYDKGYDNFYLTVNSDSTNTQLYSGKFVFYEDLTFVKEDTSTTQQTNTQQTNGQQTNGQQTGVTATPVTTDQENITTDTIDDPDYQSDKKASEINPFNVNNMESYQEDPAVDKNYFNVLIYVRFQTNMDKLDDWLSDNGITPRIKYANVYFLERVYATKVQEIKKLSYVEQVFDIQLSLGQAPKKVKTLNELQQTENKSKKVFRTPVKKPTEPVKKPFTPPKPNVVLERVVSNRVIKQDFDNTFSKTSVRRPGGLDRLR